MEDIKKALTSLQKKSSVALTATQKPPVSETVSPEKYPYGTRIVLDEMLLKKLKVDISKYSVGDKFPILAAIEVVGISRRENRRTEKQELELQITDMTMP